MEELHDPLWKEEGVESSHGGEGEGPHHEMGAEGELEGEKRY